MQVIILRCFLSTALHGKLAGIGAVEQLAKYGLSTIKIVSHRDLQMEVI
jgi:hypothetical protein